jgi:hypothetical protein
MPSSRTKLEVFAPASVVTAPLHLIHTQGALPDGWGAVLDAGGEHENGLAEARRGAILNRNAKTGLRRVAASWVRGFGLR